MEINNKNLLKRLATYGAYKMEPFETNINNDNDIIITDNEGNRKRIITENVNDNEVYLALEIKKIEILDNIKTMLKFFVILTLISLIIIFLLFVSKLSGM